MQASLGRGAGALLAAQVSRAGGLGTLGASWTAPAVLREQIGSIARVTDRPFCVNLVLDLRKDERLEVVVEERVPWVSFSFGLRPELVDRARAGGVRVLVQVASADGARAAAGAGADALIVQGIEAGGHVQSVVGLLPLLAEVRRAVSLPTARRRRDRRPGFGAGGAWRRRCGRRDGHALCGQRRVRRASALQGTPAFSRRPRHGADRPL
jgi:NAD(P)H-dependent flavin oxidoreductase YrpB (nitropropane dioxygenase family)